MLNSHQRCSNSSIFCINAKTCTTRNLHEVLQARQHQRMIIKSPGWSFYVHPLHRTLSEVAAKPRVKLGIPVGRAPVGTIAIWKVKIRYRGRMSVWNNTGKMPSMCRGYGILVRLSLWRAGKLPPLKPIVWGEAEFGRLVANKRMHGIENAAVSHSLHMDGIFRQI